MYVSVCIPQIALEETKRDCDIYWIFIHSENNKTWNSLKQILLGQKSGKDMKLAFDSKYI